MSTSTKDGKRISAPNFTQVPNVLFEWLPELTDCELRIVLVIVRQTFGWQRESSKISRRFLEKATGLSHQGVLNGIKSLLKSKLICREEDGDGFVYSLTVDDDRSNPLTGPVKPHDHPPVKRVDQKKERTGTNKDRRNKKGSHRPGVDPQEANPEHSFSEQERLALEGSNEDVSGNGSSQVAPPKSQPSLKRDLTDRWCAAFKEEFGFKYDFRGVVDGKAADRLLARGMPAEEIIGIARQAWKHPDWFYCKMATSLAKFESQFSQIRAELKTKVNGVSRYSSPGSRQSKIEQTNQAVSDPDYYKKRFQKDPVTGRDIWVDPR